MLELLLCATFTILPDYLYRRYRQGKRFGHEITLYSVWYELRFGIVTCLMLTVSLITMIFYFHPSTTSATLFYRTVPIVSEVTGRVAEVHVDVSADVKQGDVLFRLDSAKQEAALLTAKRKIAEVDAAMLAAQTDIMKAEGQLRRQRAPCSRHRTSWIPKLNCRSATQESFRSATSKSLAWPSQGARAPSTPQPPPGNQRGRGLTLCYRRKGQAQRRLWPKHKSTWIKP